MSSSSAAITYVHMYVCTVCMYKYIKLHDSIITELQTGGYICIYVLIFPCTNCYTNIVSYLLNYAQKMKEINVSNDNTNGGNRSQ